MSDILLHINDDHKAAELLRFLHELDFVEIESGEMQADHKNQSAALKSLSGLWADRDVSLATIREKAWR
jgi:hypothetical protein